MITVNNLTKIYNKGKENEVYALRNLSLRMEDGESVCIMGKSGSGKSTLLHMLGGLDTPDSGQIFFDKQEITAMPEAPLSVFRRENIGYVFQSYHLIPELTVRENIRLPALLADKELSDWYLDSLVEQLDLKDRLSHLPSQLSGGQQQRCAIARALINRPKVILCDEPTGNLDSASAETVKQVLFALQKLYRPILVIVTHDADFTALADRTIRIADGGICGEGCT